MCRSTLESEFYMVLLPQICYVSGGPVQVYDQCGSTKDTLAASRAFMKFVNPDQHIFKDATLWVRTPPCYSELDCFRDRSAVIHNSPVVPKLPCMSCDKLCRPGIVCVDFSGLPCTPFSSSGIGMREEDPVLEVHLKWCLVC